MNRTQEPVRLPQDLVYRAAMQLSPPLFRQRHGTDRVTPEIVDMLVNKMDPKVLEYLGTRAIGIALPSKAKKLIPVGFTRSLILATRNEPQSDFINQVYNMALTNAGESMGLNKRMEKKVQEECTRQVLRLWLRTGELEVTRKNDALVLLLKFAEEQRKRDLQVNLGKVSYRELINFVAEKEGFVLNQRVLDKLIVLYRVQNKAELYALNLKI